MSQPAPLSALRAPSFKGLDVASISLGKLQQGKKDGDVFAAIFADLGRPDPAQTSKDAARPAPKAQDDAVDAKAPATPTRRRDGAEKTAHPADEKGDADTCRAEAQDEDEHATPVAKKSRAQEDHAEKSDDDASAAETGKTKATDAPQAKPDASTAGAEKTADEKTAAEGFVTETASADLALEQYAGTETSQGEAAPDSVMQDAGELAAQLATAANRQPPVPESGPAAEKPAEEKAGEKSVTVEKNAPITFRPDFVPHAAKAHAAGKSSHVEGEAPANTSLEAADAVAEQAKTHLGQEIKTAIQQAKTEKKIDGEKPEAAPNMADVVHAAQDEVKSEKEGTGEHGEKGDRKASADSAKQNERFVQPVSLPTAGSRAIPVAVNNGTPTGSSAPSPNGLSGGGSPLSAAAKAESAGNASAAPTFPHGLTHAAAPEQTSFNHMVKAAKESAPATPAEQVAVQIFRATKNGMNRFDLQLTPGDLGQVDIRLEIGKEGLVRAFITADNQATLDLLQRDKATLQSTLESAGLQTDAGSLSFDLRGGEAREGGREQGFTRNKSPDWASKFARAEETKMPPEIIYYQAGDGRIDVRI